MLVVVYIDKDNQTAVGEIEQGQFIATENIKRIFASNDNAEVDKFISTHRKNYQRNGNLTSLDPNVQSIWSAPQ